MNLRYSLLAIGVFFPFHSILNWVFHGASLPDFSEKLVFSILCFILAVRIQSPTNKDSKEYSYLGTILLFIISYHSIYKTYLFHYSIEYLTISFFIFLLTIVSISNKLILFIYMVLSFIGNFLTSSLLLSKEQTISISISLFISYICLYIIFNNILGERESLFFNQEYVRSTLSDIQSGLLITDKEDKILYANLKACELISDHFHPEFLLGTKISLPIENKNKLLGIPTQIDLKQNKHIEVHYSKIIWNQEICYIITLNDLSPQFERDTKTKLHNFVLSQTLEYSKEGILNLNKNGFIVYANPFALSCLSTSSDELLGAPIQSILKSSTFEAETEESKNHPIHFTFSEGKTFTISKETFWKPNGSPFLAEYTVSPILNETDVQGAVLIFKDVSSKKEREESEVKYKNELLHLTYTANKFLEIVDESELYPFIAYEINRFFPSSSLLINLYDPMNHFFTTVSSSGFETKMNEVYSILGRDFKGLKYTDESFAADTTKSIEKTSLFNLKYGNFNRKICSQIEILSESIDTYTIPFFYKTLFLGNCILFLRESNLEITGTIEVFLNQVSVNLYKKISMKHLFQDRLREEPLISLMSLLYVEITLEGYILYVNPMFIKVSGYSLQELIGKSIWSLVLKEISLEEIDAFRQKIKFEPILDEKASFYARDGSIPSTWDWIYRKNEGGDGEIISGIGRN
jgi:PAS domain S-box-containing protein